MSTPSAVPDPTVADVVEGSAGTVGPGRRPTVVLMVSQLLAGLGVASGVAVGGLLAERISGTTAAAGLAQTASVLGAGVWAIPLARLAARRDRRWGLGAGYLLALIGIGLIFLATVSRTLPVLFLGFGCFGAATAAGLQARFAATEQVDAAHRARAMSVVLWATTLGSVAGPNLSEAGAALGRQLGIEPLTGPYLFSLLAFALAAAVIGLGLHPVGGAPETDAGPVPTVALLPALRSAVRNPVTLLALVAITCSHTVMVGVMVMTPVHMSHDGFALGLIGLVISVHILGMYGASPLFGWLTDRIGAARVLLLAVLIFAVALVVATGPATAAFVPMSVGLGLLGLGWSAGMIGGSTLLTDSVPASARTSVQGAADAIMNLAAAASAGLSGVIMGGAGFPALGVVAAVVVLPMAVLAVRSGTRRQPARL